MEMLNIFKKKSKEILVLSNRSFTKQQAYEIEEKTGKIVLLAMDVNDVRILDNKLVDLGDGMASFLGEGTEEEFKDQEKSDKGLKGIFGL